MHQPSIPCTRKKKKNHGKVDYDSAVQSSIHYSTLHFSQEKYVILFLLVRWSKFKQNNPLLRSILQFMSGVPIRVAMPIVMTLSPELRVIVPTVGGIHLVTFQEVCIQNVTSIVMEHSSN